MARFFSLLLALPLVACGLDARDPVAPAEPVPKAAEAPAEVDESGGDVAPDEGSETPPPAAPSCDPSGPYAPAPTGTPACSFDATCDADADCAGLAGTYCAPDLCASRGCLRGACLLTKVQGQACARDGECVSGKCDCAGGQCACGPEDIEGAIHFP